MPADHLTEIEFKQPARGSDDRTSARANSAKENDSVSFVSTAKFREKRAEFWRWCYRWVKPSHGGPP
jgi:hypothetical protein